MALAGALILLATTLLTERASREPAKAVAQDAGVRSAMVEADRRNSETIVAMGMTPALTARWEKVNDRFVAAAGRANDVVGSFGSFSKVLRLVLQSAMLGLGAYLVIVQELTPGSIIAASIMMGRALAPIETAIANWRPFVGARQSIRRLAETLARLPPESAVTALPKPTRGLDVEQVTVAAPGARNAIVANVTFQLKAGQALGIIGPNGSGKTSLARCLTGVWPPARGTVRLDGAALDQWRAEDRGRHVGYLSQAIDLFEGTVAENIARMSPEPNDAAVLAAAQAAGAHDLILRLPSGYDTRIGDAGTALSAGQRQRIALARALYGDPFLVVLDEPSANLDAEGEAALQQAVRGLKARGSVVIVIVHRPSALAACDLVLFLANGSQQAFGPREEVLRKVLGRPAEPPAAATANLKVVSETAGGTAQ
jgi:ATP-binding cassette subfamily C protein